jgi:hypothetical protein
MNKVAALDVKKMNTFGFRRGRDRLLFLFWNLFLSVFFISIRPIFFLVIIIVSLVFVALEKGVGRKCQNEVVCK